METEKDARSEAVHACGIVGAHVGACLDCGNVEELGWAHRCRKCWERPRLTHAAGCIDEEGKLECICGLDDARQLNDEIWHGADE